jgi:hypothetical protein
MVNIRRVISLAVLALTLVAAAALASQLALQGAATGPNGTPAPSPLQNPKLEAAGRDTPPPPRPTQSPWRAQQASDILANLPRDANFDNTMRGLTGGADPDPRAVGRKPALGTPLFVRGLRPTDGNEFLVPVVVDSTTIAVMVVPIDRDGNGRLVATRGWSSAPSFPAQSADAAIALAGLSGQRGIRAELVWTDLRGVASDLSPFWRIELAGRAISYVFEDSKVISASDLGLE